MKISFTYIPEGRTCERCGTFIKNTYMVEDAHIKMIVGSECIKKVSNVSDYGMKVINKTIRNIKAYQTRLADFLTKDYDILKEKYYNGFYGMIEIPWNERLDINDPNYASYRPKTIEEFKKEIERLTRLYPAWIENELKELNKKTKSINIKSKGDVL